MSRLPTIVILAFYFPPAPEIGGWRLYRFAKYLAEAGHRVEVICAGAVKDADEPFNVTRIPETFDNPILRRLHGYTEFFLRKFALHDWGAWWKLKADKAARRILDTCEPGAIVLSSSPPVFPHMIAAALRDQYDCRWVADFRDPLFGNLARQEVLYKGFDEKLERRIFDNADLVIANTELLASNWTERYPAAAGNIKVLENGFDPADFEQPTEPTNRAFNLMSHVGYVYGSRDPRPLLQAISNLAAAKRISADAFRLLFYGGISDFIVEDAAFVNLKALGILEHRDTAPHKADSEALMRSSDTLLVIGFASDLQVPAKLYFYIRTGRPILAYFPRGAASEGILEKCGVPYRLIHPDDPAEVIEQAVLEILEMPRDTYPASTWFLERFDARLQSQALSRWVVELGNRS